MNSSYASWFGSRTRTTNGQPGKMSPSKVTQTEWFPSSTQNNLDQKCLDSGLNTTGVLNANPDGVCTVHTMASRPDMTRDGFAGWTNNVCVSCSSGRSPPTPRTTHSPAIKTPKDGESEYLEIFSLTPLTLKCTSCRIGSSISNRKTYVPSPTSST